MLPWIAVLALAGCGNGTDEPVGSPPTLGPVPSISTPSPAPAAPAVEGLSLVLRHTEPLRAGSPVTWTLEVANHGTRPVTLVFGSGQRGDVVLRRGPEERYRWSRGRVFTQVLGEMPLAPGQVQSYELTESGLGVEPGQYELVATLATRPAPPEVRRSVAVVP